MPLNRRDSVELSRQVEQLLREYDPGSLDIILRATESQDDPRRYLLSLLQTVRRVYAERSGGMHGPILDHVNHFVRLPNGNPIRGISVSLSPGERERYGTDEVNLAELPDRSEFLGELDRLLQLIGKQPVNTTRPQEIGGA